MISKPYARYVRWKGWVEQEFGTCDRLNATYFRRELTVSGLHDLAGCRVLEIGFGNGAFAVWAEAQGMAYKGTEVIPALISRAKSRSLDVYDGNVRLGSVVSAGSMDLVVAFDVFEHMLPEELRAHLNEVCNCLRAGGLLLARMPSGDSPFSRSIQHGDLTHRTTLGSSAVGQLAVETGFELLAVREPAFPLHGNGLLSGCRRTAVHLARRLTFPVIATLFMGGGSPVLTPNMVFVLRKP